MKKQVLAAVDAGNKNLKVMIDGLSEPILIPNILCNVTKLNEEINGDLLGRKQINPINLLDLTIASNGKELGRKYLGGAAIIHGGEERPLRKEKYNDESILFAIVGGLAYGLAEQKKISKQPLFLGTCLPTNEAYDAKKKQYHQERLIGNHQVKFNHPYFNGLIVDIEIQKNDHYVVQEGLAALINTVTDDNGYELKEFSNMEDRIFIIADIGGGTTDISAAMNYNLVVELNAGLDKGILYAEQNIIKTLKKDNPDYYISKTDLDYRIRKKNGILIDRDKEIDIKNIADREFAALSETIAKEINNQIQSAPDYLKHRIAKIILTGGSTLLLSDYIKREIPDFQVITSTNSLNDNVLGCYKSAKMKIAEKEAAMGEEEAHNIAQQKKIE